MMTDIFTYENTINYKDNRIGLLELPEKCAQLIIADPPYFKVKGEFDFVWKTFDEYLEFMEVQAQLYKRILADNGTLFVYGHAKRIAYVQVIFDKYFNLENSMVWRKPDSMQYQYYSIGLSRCFNTHNERILMYTNDFEPSDWNKTGTERIMEEFIKPNNPFSIYLKQEFQRAGVSNAELRRFIVGELKMDSAMLNRWFDGDCIIREDLYLRLRDYLNGEYLRKEYEDIRKEYEDIRKEYEDIRKEYEDQRRYFNNFMKLEDVLVFSQEGHNTKNYDHDTKKPEKLTRALILTCSRPNDLVVVPFAGSGTECAMAAKDGRRYIGYETNEKYVEIARERCNNITRQPDIFHAPKENTSIEQLKIFKD